MVSAKYPILKEWHPQDDLEVAPISSPGQQPVTDIEDPRPDGKEPHDHELHTRDRQNIYSSLTYPIDERRWCTIFPRLETRQAETSGQGFSEETEDEVDDAHAYPHCSSKLRH
jgi:hypothetical protein